MRASALFAAISGTSDVREAWLGLATARRRLGDAAGAAEALAAALRRHVPDPGFAALADAIARDAGAPGWCGMSGDGKVTLECVPLPMREADGGRGPSPRSTPARKGRGRICVVAADGRELLGSPIDVAAITATVGCVSCRDGGLTGWAWHPGDPSVDPVLTIRPANGRGRLSVTASDTGIRIDSSGLLARPRGFTVPAAALKGLTGLLHVRGRDGRDLLGSPLDPRAELAVPVADRGPAASPRRRPPVDVVVAVHGGTAHTLACLDSVLANLPRPSRLIVVDDASPEPELVAALDALARRRRITLIRHTRNRGFAASANAGIRATAGRDVVLLNSDTLVAPGWLEELRDVAYSARRHRHRDAAVQRRDDPELSRIRPAATTCRISAETAHVRLAGATGERRHRDRHPGRRRLLPVHPPRLPGRRRPVPRRSVRPGLRRGERLLPARAPSGLAARRGTGGVRRPCRRTLVRRRPRGICGRATQALLERLHPGYAALIEAHVRADPLAAARRRLDLARWRAARRRGSQAVVLITHAAGGGVERQIAASVERHRDGGLPSDRAAPLACA